MLTLAVLFIFIYMHSTVENIHNSTGNMTHFLFTYILTIISLNSYFF